ncbi:MAG: hypothetical protein KKE59_06730, partial [Proteobacteria bacterium]|nr:hypothetical protein [Pseudomonadota bacterium]
MNYRGKSNRKDVVGPKCKKGLKLRYKFKPLWATARQDVTPFTVWSSSATPLSSSATTVSSSTTATFGARASLIHVK